MFKVLIEDLGSDAAKSMHGIPTLEAARGLVKNVEKAWGGKIAASVLYEEDTDMGDAVDEYETGVGWAEANNELSALAAMDVSSVRSMVDDVATEAERARFEAFARAYVDGNEIDRYSKAFGYENSYIHGMWRGWCANVAARKYLGG